MLLLQAQIMKIKYCILQFFLIKVTLSSFETWRKIWLEKNETFFGGRVTSDKITLKSQFLCAVFAYRCPWCTSWCYDEVTRECLVSDIYVSPLRKYEGSNGRYCFTPFPKDFALNSNICVSQRCIFCYGGT